MIKLKDLVAEQKYTRISDMEIVRIFFTENDLEEEGLDLIQELTKSKIEKMKHKLHIVREWTSWLPSEYLYRTYDLDIADALHKLELDFLSNGCELSNQRLEWAKKNIPNIKRPAVYFNPLIEWMDDCGIRFKDEEPLKDDEKIYLRYV